MDVGDKVRVVDKPISLLKQHAGREGIIVKKGFNNEWLVDLGGYHQWWWAKGYDIEVIEDDKEFGNICKNPLAFRIQ